MEDDKKRIRLEEITLMRTILAFLIVFMHAFTCYNGGWKQPLGYVDIPLYKWLARFSFAYTLEAFVFISGYLFAFQRITLNRVENEMGLIVNKLKRLMLPSIIFSALYFVIFYEYKGVSNMLYSIINGCGHMWYLPMLFWCFIGGWLLEKIKIKSGWKVALLVLLNLFMFVFILKICAKLRRSLLGKGFAKVTISINLGDNFQKQVTISKSASVSGKA